MIDFQCPKCGQQYNVAEIHGGKKIDCRKCQARLSIPLFPDGAAIQPPPVPPSVAPPLPPAIPAAPPPMTSTRHGEPSKHELIVASTPPKDPILMAVLSFFIPWLGQMVIGQVTKGIVMLFLTPILVGLFIMATLGMGVMVLPFVGVVAVIDAYLLAKKLKEGQAIGKWEFFGVESAATLAKPLTRRAERRGDAYAGR